MNLLRRVADVTGRILGDLAGHTLNTLWPEPFHLAADDLWADTGGHHHEIALLKEIAGHTAAVRALLEDTRNLLNHASAAGNSPFPAAERPAPTRLTGAGHPDNADLDDLLLYECPNPSCPCHGGFCNAQKVGSGWPGCAKPYGHSGQHGYAGLFWDSQASAAEVARVPAAGRPAPEPSPPGAGQPKCFSGDAGRGAYIACSKPAGHDGEHG